MRFLLILLLATISNSPNNNLNSEEFISLMFIVQITSFYQVFFLLNEQTVSMDLKLNLKGV